MQFADGKKFVNRVLFCWNALITCIYLPCGGPLMNMPDLFLHKHNPSCCPNVQHMWAALQFNMFAQGIDNSLRTLGVEALDLVQFYWHDYGVDKYVGAAQRLQVLLALGCAVLIVLIYSLSELLLGALLAQL